VHLPEERCSLPSESLRIPSGVKVVGDVSTRLVVIANRGPRKPVFIVSDAENVHLSNFTLELGPNMGGIEITDSTNVLIEGVSILGDFTANAESTSPLVTKNVQRMFLKRSTFEHTVGTISIHGEELVVSDNSFFENSGGIELSGTSISFQKNSVIRTGKQGAFNGPPADSLTLATSSRDVKIIQNLFDDSSRTLLATSGTGKSNISSLEIRGNTFTRGDASALDLIGVSSGIISFNQFVSNGVTGNGIQLTQPSRISLHNNLFFYDGISIQESNGDNRIESNNFIKVGTSPIAGEPLPSDIHQNNNILP